MESTTPERKKNVSEKPGLDARAFFVYLPPALLYTLLGWGGVLYLWLFTLPTVGIRWLFFLFFFLGMTGLAMPLVALLNWRFRGTFPASQGVVTRQAIWFGVFGCLVGWMQISRVLTPAMALLLAVGLFFVEWLIRMVELSLRSN